MNSTTNQGQTKPIAVFMMGGPASGKSTIREREYGHLTVVDCDLIKAEHPEYDPKNPGAIHDWSSNEATRRFFAALGTGESVVFDGTGHNAEKYVNFMQAAQSAGYETEVCYVAVDLATGLARNAQRERRVSEDVVRERYSRIATSFEIVSRYADRVRVIKN